MMAPYMEICVVVSDLICDKTRLILVTGGHGFIGSHVSKKLHEDGFRIRIADKSPICPFNESICEETLLGNLCDADFCSVAVSGVNAVLHFAATMGGMGTIHSENDFPIYEENSKMTLNILRCSVANRVRGILYASSACVYPDSLQTDPVSEVSLKEDDAWSTFPPQPQGLYGLEKLISEQLLYQYSSKIQIRVARFHNVYGPRGAWKNGYEKAPAALLRKAIAARLLNTNEMEIWGNGSQKRSFLYIDDAVDAIIKLLHSDYKNPLNIGSDNAVSILDLANIAWECAGGLRRELICNREWSRPVGVISRNSNNERVKKALDWSPRVTLQEGMKKTADWMAKEIEAEAINAGEQRELILKVLQKSSIVNLQDKIVSFALLLPVTSRGSGSPSDCLVNLAKFASSLSQTTWRDCNELGGLRFSYRVYLAIDDDDDFLRHEEGGANRALKVLNTNGIANVATIISRHPKGHVCSIWRECARKAWEDGLQFFVLLGDDVTLEDEGWMRKIYDEFVSMTYREHVPFGIGCVAFTDLSFPGMPTFPVIHRTHMDIFGGEVIPKDFINQDGDPYLFQMYRRWGCSVMTSCRVLNGIGGSGDARYEKRRALDWTYDCLNDGVEVVERYLKGTGCSAERKLSLDVVVPCYRVQLPLLKGILELNPSDNCTTMFIIIVDDPSSPFIHQLQHEYGHRADVRIRVNSRNLGASASRNRGIEESAAEWVIFLDDDVVPETDLLIETENIIRRYPKAAGFVANVHFPVADSVFKTAIHLSGVTYFWNIAEKWDDNGEGGGNVPWGVTANLISRRNIKDGIRFDLGFPKTGGGEDIDFCLKKHQYFNENVTEGEGFHPAPKAKVTHPWWNNGKRTYWRYHMWSKGDGGLVIKYPEFTYWDCAPNSGEMLGLVVLLLPISFCVAAENKSIEVIYITLCAACSVVIANVLHDAYRHLYRDRGRTLALNSSIKGVYWMMAVVESSFIRMFSEIGRLVGIVERGEYSCIMRRFDWFVGRVGPGPRQEERLNSVQRLSISVVVFCLLVQFVFW